MSLAVVSMLLTGLSSLAARLVDETRTQIVADAAALAGVIGGESLARRVAGMNGAVLCEYVNEEVVAVQVCIRSTMALAYAREQQDDGMPTLKP